MSEESLDFAEFVRLMIETLDVVGVDYLIGGAVAAWAWGEPRATLDLDLVVNIPLETVSRLSKELEKRGMLVPEEIILDHLLDDRVDVPINAIHMYSGYKADLYLLRAGDELSQSAFQRRKRIDLGPQFGWIYLHSPEDLIIYKLCYYSLSQQTKHLRDITAMVLALGDELDFDYIAYWVDRRGVLRLWNEMLRQIRST